LQLQSMRLRLASDFVVLGQWAPIDWGQSIYP